MQVRPLDPTYPDTSGCEGFTISVSWMHHYLHCCCSLSLKRLHKSSPLSCIFACACMYLLSLWKPNSPSSTFTETNCPTTNQLCQRASTDLLSSYFQHFLSRRSPMTAPLSLLARGLWHVSGSEFQHAPRHLIRQQANRCVSWVLTLKTILRSANQCQLAKQGYSFALDRMSRCSLDRQLSWTRRVFCALLYMLN